MKLESIVRTFIEKYDESAINSLSQLSDNYGLVIHHHTFNGFNIKEAYEIFNKYLRGYGDYIVESLNNHTTINRSDIKNSVNMFIENKIFKDQNIEYSNITSFITEYINGVHELIDTINDIKYHLMCENADTELIGDINTYTDLFIERMETKFTSVMDNLLWASGYKSNKRIFENKPVTKSVSIKFI